MKVKDIRIDFFEKNTEKRDIEIFILDIALKFLKVCSPISIGNTEILKIYFTEQEKDGMEEKINGIHIFHPKWYGNISEINAYFPITIFKQFSSNKQIHYSFRFIYNILYKLSLKYNKENIILLNNAYLISLKDNFTFETKIYKFKRGKIILFQKDYLHYTDYFFKKGNDFFFLERKNKIPFSVWENYTFEEKLNTALTFDVEWDNQKEIIFSWGEEKIIFNAETKTIEYKR